MGQLHTVTVAQQLGGWGEVCVQLSEIYMDN
jgi:hypothetical protein